MLALQASCVAIGDRAILIEGAPGIGKSNLALALIDRGARLVGDDSVLLDAERGRLCARPHPNTRGLIEVRNLGLLKMPVCERAMVALALRLDEGAPRFVEKADVREIAGIAIPLLCVWPAGAMLALKAELALERFGLSPG